LREIRSSTGAGNVVIYVTKAATPTICDDLGGLHASRWREGGGGRPKSQLVGHRHS